MKRASILLLVITVSLCACKKGNECEQIRQSLYDKDREEVGGFINSYIYRSDRDYNRDNLTKLSARINGNCDIRASQLCFDCIQTLPSQTEIELRFQYAGSEVVRIIDLSYTKDNQIRYSNVHE